MAIHSLALSRLKPEQRHELEDRLWERQKHVCFICERPIDLELQRKVMEIDHIIPVAADGKDEENNFVLTHEACNRRKSSSDLRVARVLERFNRIEQEADDGTGQGANLGHVLKAYGGATKPLRMLIGKNSVRFSASGTDETEISEVPLCRERQQGVQQRVHRRASTPLELAAAPTAAVGAVNSWP